MLSQVDINKDSLLIIDEAHNLRNFGTKEIKEKISARKWKDTGDFSLMGNKVADLLLKNKNTFLRTIMMTGTLFCNSKDDIEALIGIGYKKAPLVNQQRQELLQIQNDPKQFDRYYGGLISFFRLSDNDPDFPRKKYHFVPIGANMSFENAKDDPYFQAGRNSGMEEKIEWIYNFLTSEAHKGEKTLIYAEFMDDAITMLMTELKKNNFNVVEITGSETIKEKQAGIKLYNTNKIQLLVFSKAIKEGISFKETNNFIFIQPYWNYAISEQIIARAVRLDSHKEKQKSLVNIYCLIGVNESVLENIIAGKK
jgi:SNF2 family DNA or RNA helicase